jgi:predicted RNA binding protein YcfA (HicA-like mRNA interferase family)
MSEKLPRLTAREIMRVLQRRGFSISRSSGSHQIFKDAAGRRVTLPVHTGKIIHPKVLQSILHDMDMTAEELKSELGR